MIKEAGAVSFDLFDTLVTRPLPLPMDLFSLLGGEDFCRKRVDAEVKARKSHEDREVTEEDIYALLPGSSKESEEEVETALSCPLSGKGRQIYSLAGKLHKRILITTDMYLRRPVIEAILKKAGIRYDALYLSSERGAKKRDGRLFSLLLKEEGIDASSLLHIGDHPLSDGKIPSSMGIHTILVKNPHGSRTLQKIRGKARKIFPASGKVLEEGLLKGLIREELKKKGGGPAAGFEILGPLLYGYAHWLDLEFSKEKDLTVLFLSREGHLIREAYEEVREYSDPKRMYFYASRRALQVPAMLSDLSFEGVMGAMFLPFELDMKWLLHHWGLAEKETPEAWGEAGRALMEEGLSFDTPLTREEAMGDPRVPKLYSALLPRIKENAEAEKEGLAEYVREAGIHGRVALVDIGWNGNMQRAFIRTMKVVDPDIRVTGYYLGTFSGKNEHDQVMHSYLHLPGKNADGLKDLYCHTALELFFMAGHGSLGHYRTAPVGTGERRDLPPQAVLLPFEYGGSPTGAYAKEIQKDAMDLIRRWETVGNILPDRGIYQELSLRPFRKLRFSFAKNDMLKEIGDLTALDGDEEIPLAKPDSFSAYLKHPGRLKRDLLHASFKTGFLKRLLRLPLPYVGLLCAVRKRIVK